MYDPNKVRAQAMTGFGPRPMPYQPPPQFGGQYQGMAGTHVAPQPAPRMTGGSFDGPPAPRFGGGGGPPGPNKPPPGYGYVWDGEKWVRPTPPPPEQYGGSGNPGGG